MKGIILVTLFVAVFGAKYELPKPPECGSMNSTLQSGIDVGFYDFPWTVFISYGSTTKGDISCAGVLISKRHVLTTANCVSSIFNSLYFQPHVYIGDYDVSKNPDCIDNVCTNNRVMSYTTSVQHPDYEYTRHIIEGNLALLHLEADVEFSDTMRPICLPSAIVDYTISEAGEELYLSGWPKPSNLGKSTYIKKKQLLPVLDEVECNKFSTERCGTEKTSNEFCLGFGTLSGCDGYLGGGAMKKVGDYWVLEGLFNDWTKCQEQSDTGTFITPRIHDYERWIEDALSTLR